MTLDKVKLKTINNNSIIGDGNISVGGSSVDIVTSWSSTTSDSKVPSEKLAKDSLDGKANSSHTHTKSQITDFPTLSTVATSGSYNDLSNKPTIPTAISDLTNDSDFIETSSTTGLIKNDGSIDTNTYLTDVSTWTSQAIATYGTLYVNTALRLCEFRYSRTSYNFSSTAQVTLHSAVIPTTYRPKYTYYLASWDNQVSIAVTENGDILAYTSSKATRNIFATGMWHY